MRFSEKIKKIRTDNGLSQEDLARKIYVSQTVVSKWEAGQEYPDIYSLQRIAELFNLTLDDLISEEDIFHEKALEDKRARKSFFFSVCGLIVAVVFILLAKRTGNRLCLIGYGFGVIAYMVFAYFSMPEYKREERSKNKILFWLPKIFVSFLLVLIFIGAFIF